MFISLVLDLLDALGGRTKSDSAAPTIEPSAITSTSANEGPRS